MEELIDKKEAINIFKKCGSSLMSNDFVIHKLSVMQTTTEAEIRNKAISEFAEKMKWEYENSIGIPQREIDFAKAVTDQVAEQLKER